MADDPLALDEGFAILAPDSEPPAADVELQTEEDLASGADTTVIDSEAPPPLARSYAYDFIQHRFIPGQAGGPLMTYGLDTLRLWIEKCIRTRRGENPACDRNFGVEILPSDLFDGGPFDAGAMAEYEDSVRRGLLVHPRIVEVEAFQVDVDPNDDIAAVSFRVIPEGDDLDVLDFDQIPLPLGDS